MAHKVTFSMPELEVGHSDIEFLVLPRGRRDRPDQRDHRDPPAAGRQMRMHCVLLGAARINHPNYEATIRYDKTRNTPPRATSRRLRQHYQIPECRRDG
jgi:hypothetical protein